MSPNTGAVGEPTHPGAIPIPADSLSDFSDPIERPSRVRYVVLGWLCVATMIAYIDRGSISVADSLIRNELGISKTQMGWAMSAFFITYALFQFPGAMLDRRWGSRLAIPFFSVAWSLATAACGLATGMLVLLPARLAMGGAEAGIFPAATAVIGRWFPASKRASMSGVLASFMGVGGAVGAALSGMMLGLVSWQWMFLIYAVPGILWSIIFFGYFRETPGDHPGVNEAERKLVESTSVAATPSKGDDRSMSWAILKQRAVLGLAAQQFFRALGSMFYMSWFPTFLQETRGVDVQQSGMLSSLPHLATMAGSLTGGYLSDYVLARSGSLRLARQGIAVASMIGCMFCIVLASYVSNPLLSVLIFSLGAFAAALAGPCAYALTIDLGGRETRQVFSLMNTSGAIGSIVFPTIAPWLLARTGSWSAVVAVFAATHAAAALCWVAFDADRPLTQPAREHA